MNGLDWNKLLESHGAALVLYARQWTNSHADAEDAVQEGFVRFWKVEGVKDKGGESLPYLFISVKHAALDGIRSGNRRSMREEEVAASVPTECVFDSDLETRERNQQIQAAIETLPPDQREVLVLKIWGDLTFKMVAEALAVSINTAASRYRYALEALHKELANSEICHE